MFKIGKVKSKRNRKETKSKCRKVCLWIIMTLVLAIIMGILHGTTEYYLDTQELMFGLYMNWGQFFIIIGVGIWTALSLIIFKGGVEKY